MNHSRTLNNKMKRVHERSFQLVYNNKKTTLNEKSEYAHNMHTVSPSIMYEVSQIDNSNNYNVMKNKGFNPGNPKTVYYWPETISLLRTKLWISLIDKYENLELELRTSN